MSEDQGEAGTGSSPWSIPDWYRRTGMASWYFLGIFFAVTLVAVIVAATSEITAPLVLGGFLAVVFLPVLDWLVGRGLKRGLASGVVLAGLVVVLGSVSWMTWLALAEQADDVAASIDSAIQEIEGWLAGVPIDEGLVRELQQALNEAASVLLGGLAGGVVSVLDSALALITGLILGTIVFYYLLKDGASIFERRLEREEDAQARELYRKIGEGTVLNVQGYFRGRTAMALVNGVTIGVAALALGVPAAGAIGVVNFVGAYIPYLGGFIGGAFAVLMALGEGGFGLALLVLVITLVVNIVLENVLEPRLLGGSLNLHPLLILLATSLGGMIAGMIGLILAAPALAIALNIKTELKLAGFFDDR